MRTMLQPPDPTSPSILLLVAGLGGAIGTTLTAAAAVQDQRPELLQPYLTTLSRYPDLPAPVRFEVAGWDAGNGPLVDRLAAHAVVPPALWEPQREAIARTPFLPAPPVGQPLKDQVAVLRREIRSLRQSRPDQPAVMVNLLPAAPLQPAADGAELDDLDAVLDASRLPDLAYVTAAVEAGLPVINFTPNAVELPAVIKAAAGAGVPIVGRDGKTGQTYFKVVLASALRARSLKVDGWYSVNILGNADGANLEDPHCAAGKLANKTDLLDDILGYRVGARYDRPTHMVRIDYYPPRGDAKEAWDVIDIEGLFGLPMSIRVDLQGRDSILAAPLVFDLARWTVALQRAGRGGSAPELAFYFKKTVGPNPPASFAGQLAALDRLALACGATPRPEPSA